MKAYKILTSIALGAAFLSSCSSDDALLENPNYPADNIVRVTAQVDEPSSRSMTTDKLKKFYLSITNSANPNYTYDHVKFEKTDGTWQPEKQLLWQNATQKVKVQAETWKPEAGLDPPRVETNQSILENYDKSDYLWYYDDNFVPHEKLNDKKIDINFKHGLSLFDIQVTYGTEFNASTPLAATKISNMKVKGCGVVFLTFFQGTSFGIASTGDAADIIPYHYGFTAATTQASHAVDNFSCILAPQTITAGNFIVEFVANGKFYQWTSTADITLETGKKYQLNLVLGKDLVMAGNITPTAWNDQDGGDLETE